MMSSVVRALAVLACLAATPVLAQSTSPATPPAKAAPSTTKAAPASAPAAAAKATLLDINSASVEELSKLKGIGEVRSAAIVKGRPYKGKDELVQKNIIPEGVYAGIKDQIIAKQK